MNCGKCRDELIKEDGLFCMECKTCFHHYCQGMNDNSFGKMSKNTKSKWVCSDCKTEWNNKKGNQSNSDKNDEIKQLTDSVKYMSDKFDQFNLTVGKILNEMKELRDQNQKLFEKNEKLSTEVQQLKAKIDELDQKSLENAVEITGIPIMRNEDCKSIVQEISEKLEINCDVLKAYRITTKHKTDMKIIAWLSNNNDRNRLVTEAKKNKWAANQYRGDWPSSKIYINNHLTKFRRLLLWKTKTLAKEKGYKYVWMNSTDILVRKDENTKVTRIYDEIDLNKII
ncbi:unnamed protein product [Macrosiphum euphorbiae]|uniref:FP protein C-terminal domain-containing protein n=2 Tax=Macrosiphum euphorbiae TaxID=13131 RepID=A0AAV0XAG9_9HEMI|nr:unnamed protein product [Macrosiphum euphorbiae]CAI6354865.1 unnamed protein product [Macrosiphum euphorbiae]CAI6360296.1 unnamed protein product [Macrosiphum euphorbiae]CAI6365399.1 unnamed protein product [Macrosiphum euphorbiae]CAI6371294.1 unnamed protein product [Macrosiphum euphorbiae]